MSEHCGCSGNSSCTCPTVTNRPGLSSLAYRAGTYATFRRAMQDRISGSDLLNMAGELPLSSLTSRDLTDAAIALLDAWAVVGDVLTFYQERIANEAYLRTATERSSVLALAGLVGYKPKPGVSASAFLAYTLESGSTGIIPAGTQAQSKPVASAMPQTFETSEDLNASGAWNNLAPRLTQPQVVTDKSSAIYLAGLSLNLRPNDPLLVGADVPVPKRIATVEAQVAQRRTLVTLQADTTVEAEKSDTADTAVKAETTVEASTTPVAAKTIAADATERHDSPLRQGVMMLNMLKLSPAVNPPSSEHLFRSVSTAFAEKSDTAPAMLKTLFPRAALQIYNAMRNSAVVNPSVSQVAALRIQATPFGSSAPQKPITTSEGAVIGTEEWPIGEMTSITITLAAEAQPGQTSGVALRSDSTFSAQPTSTVTIAQGTASATAQVPIGTQGVAATKIGTSSVSASSTEGSITWTTTNPDRKFTLVRKLEGNTQQVELTVDAATQPITVPQGQSASFGGDAGKRTTVTYGRAVVIQDTAPGAMADRTVLELDSIYDHIVPDSWVVIERAGVTERVPLQVKSTQRVAVSRYNLSAKVTRLTLKGEWLSKDDVTLSAIRNITVLAQSEVLPLADEPIPDDIAGDSVELEGVCEGLATGRWLVVQGTRTDIPQTSGIPGAEVVMLAGVTQQAAAGDTVHSSIKLASKLAYTYDRSSVVISGNVVQASHGMTRTEVLGSGDSTQVLQQFSLRQPPLTYVSASTPTGAESTLSVTVNDLTWSEIASMDRANSKDRVYVTQRDDEDQTSIHFGDGVHGMRLPTGTANVAASYRTGLGTGANLPANQISLLASKPPGVRSVTNPVGSSGGADRESMDDVRSNTPVTVTALDRLVSVSDYADFARSFAGVTKATSARISDGREQVVSVTIAGAEAGNLDTGSALFINLRSAFEVQGDRYQPLHLDVCEYMLLILDARVQCLPGYKWDAVAGSIRAALLSSFGFAQAQIGQPVHLSQVISVVQRVRGVQSVYIAAFDSISRADAATSTSFTQKLAQVSSSTTPESTIPVQGSRFDPAVSGIAPGQIAFFSADLPDTLILTGVSA